MNARAEGVTSASLGWLATAGVLAVVAQGALYRVALARAGLGPGGLQWRGAEWRVLAVSMLTAVFLGVLALLALVGVICAAWAVASAGPGFRIASPQTWPAAVDARGRLAVYFVAIAGAAGIGWAAARLSLAAAVSVESGGVQVLGAWGTTRDRAGAIVAAWLLLALTPSALLWSTGRVAASAPPLGALAACLAQGLVAAGLWLPMHVGLMAYHYRRIKR